jgi:hypothetical protein
LGTEEQGPANPNAVSTPTATQVEAALSSLASALSALSAKEAVETAIANNIAGLVEAPAAIGTTPSTSTSSPSTSPSTSTSVTDSNPADLGGDPGVSASLGAEQAGPSTGDMSSGGDGNGGGGEPTLDVVAASPINAAFQTPTLASTAAPLTTSQLIDNLYGRQFLGLPDGYEDYGSRGAHTFYSNYQKVAKGGLIGPLSNVRKI